MTLYLKYRPKDFENLEWQHFIKQTLSQAIAQNKLVGAYLFCGPRGTGKTSTARIFAKAINCLHPKNWNPCGICEICTAFDEEKLVDIIEIDAASYTWVDNVREIIERASFMPNICKYKVYIIDEVHMLSKWAFNALLKILEEPPEHLKFILATTEIQKIPETILSRCQRYDFKSISAQDVASRLRFVAQNEGITIDQESIDFIVKQANGGLRNALSLFEQLIVDNHISFERVIENYWIPKQESIANFYQKLLQKDASILQDFEEISARYNINLFFKELLFYGKDMMLEHIETPTLSTTIFLLETLETAYQKAKNSFDPKVSYLIGIVKCIQWNEFISLTSQPTENLSWASKNVKSVSSEPKKIEPEPKKEEVLSSWDVLDVFWDQDTFSPISTPEEVWSFDRKVFLEYLKKTWVKASVVTSLREAGLVLRDEKKLFITPKTEFVKKWILQSESLACITEACQNMGFKDIEIIIE